MLEFVFALSIFLILYTYAGYPIILAIWVKFKKNRNIQHRLDKPPTVSLLISAYNEEDVIVDKIDNLSAMDYPADLIEILIGSDGSNDKTNQILASCTLKNLKFFPFNIRRGKPAVLNDLAEMATGEILTFSDANSHFFSDTLLALTQPFANSAIGGVLGNLSFDSSGPDNPGAMGERIYFNYDNIVKKLEGELYSTIVANGAVYAIRRELYIPIPTKRLIMDDMFIPLSILNQGFDIIFCSEARASELPSFSLREEFRKKERVAAGSMEAMRYYTHLLHPKHGFISLALWSHKILRWSIPVLLFSLFSVNIILINSAPIYQISFILQLSFYILAILGRLLEKRGIKINLLRLLYYFVVVNLAIVSGFIKFVFGNQKVSWKRTRRK